MKNLIKTIFNPISNFLGTATACTLKRISISRFRSSVKLLMLITLYTSISSAQQFGSPVTVRTDQPQLFVTMIEDAMAGKGSNHIKILPALNGDTTMLINDDYMDTQTAFPTISLALMISADKDSKVRIVLNSGASKTLNRGEGNYNAFYVIANAVLYLQYISLESFVSNGNGGAISAAENAIIYLLGVTLYNNFSFFEGGAIFLLGNAKLFAMNSTFEQNQSTGMGGFISIRGRATAFIFLSIIVNNLGLPFGCDFNVNSNPLAGLFALTLIANTMIADCSNVLIENPFGPIFLLMNMFTGKGDLLDSTALVWLFANIINLIANSNEAIAAENRAVCNDFGTNSIKSLGYNISTENSCSLNQATDMENTDPLLNAPDANNIISLTANSPAIDAGAADMQTDLNGNRFLPCSYKDVRGLGRPQDANGDGVFECDIGAYEQQGGLDLSNAQSGLFFDIDRSGEGIIVEMLDAGLVLVTMFTYHPNGTDMMWFIGVGQVQGNTVVLDSMQRTSGGGFAGNFDPDNVIRTTVGSMSLVFPDCETTANPGRLIFQAGFQFSDELEDLLVKNNRLTQILGCNQTQNNPQAGRSGSFFDPARSGEGVFVEILEDGRAVVIFYTYTSDGRQFWFISSDTQINGNTVTANMVYPASTTGFGSQFNADEIDLQPWGTLSIVYQPGCNRVVVNFNSVIAGFGADSLNYQRLTQPAGVTCDL
jgi:hypothetical protein